MKRPFITIKFAQTLDGKIASSDGSSKWISSKESLKFAHRLRANNDAILVGIGTILSDDSKLTTRLMKGKNPIRVIIDRKLRVPSKAKILSLPDKDKTIIFTTKAASKNKIKELIKKGTEIIVLPVKGQGHIDLRGIIRILYKKGIRNILVEGGSSIITSFIKERLADRLVSVISPKIIGKGISFINDIGITNIKHALQLKPGKIKKVGKDIIYVASFVR
jgi:diaminohydroxyphosphoribosylaminopyrimidine deaminase / 5-amino-6-(5-phosphoribosylamino)uracil reductase